MKMLLYCTLLFVWAQQIPALPAAPVSSAIPPQRGQQSLGGYPGTPWGYGVPPPPFYNYPSSNSGWPFPPPYYPPYWLPAFDPPSAYHSPYRPDTLRNPSTFPSLPPAAAVNPPPSSPSDLTTSDADQASSTAEPTLTSALAVTSYDPSVEETTFDPSEAINSTEVRDASSPTSISADPTNEPAGRHSSAEITTEPHTLIPGRFPIGNTQTPSETATTETAGTELFDSLTVPFTNSAGGVTPNGGLVKDAAVTLPNAGEEVEKKVDEVARQTVIRLARFPTVEDLDGVVILTPVRQRIGVHVYDKGSKRESTTEATG